jgi:hypothetical protein
LKNALQTWVLLILLASFSLLINYTVQGKTKIFAAENTCITELISKFLEKETLKDFDIFSFKKLILESVVLSDYLDCCIQSYYTTYSIFSKNIEKQKLYILYWQFKAYCH